MILSVIIATLLGSASAVSYTTVTPNNGCPQVKYRNDINVVGALGLLGIWYQQLTTNIRSPTCKGDCMYLVVSPTLVQVNFTVTYNCDGNGTSYNSPATGDAIMGFGSNGIFKCYGIEGVLDVYFLEVVENEYAAVWKCGNVNGQVVGYYEYLTRDAVVDENCIANGNELANSVGVPNANLTLYTVNQTNSCPGPRQSNGNLVVSIVSNIIAVIVQTLQTFPLTAAVIGAIITLLGL